MSKFNHAVEVPRLNEITCMHICIHIYISRMDSFLIGAYEWFVPKKQVYMAPSPCQLLVQRIYIYIYLHIYTYVCIFIYIHLLIYIATQKYSRLNCMTC